MATSAASAPSAIIVVPPWPRSGSSNIFACQARSYADLGYKVQIVIGAYHRWHRFSDAECDALSTAMQYEGVDSVAICRATDKMHRFVSRSYLQWRLAGADTAIDIAARYAAGARWPNSILPFIEKYPPRIVHVNHVFEMLLGQDISTKVQSITGSRPLLLCDTHDVQSEAYRRRSEINHFTKSPDTYERLLASERKYYDLADILIHCSDDDRKFFQKLLPRHNHELCLPSLDPRTERALTQIHETRSPVAYDFIYLGNSNHPNYLTVKWLLSEVLPLLEKQNIKFKLAIVGTVGQWMKRYSNDLFLRYEHLFVGEVEDITQFYRDTRTVLVPSKGGTGCSIKLIESLCSGKAIIGNADSLRGLPQEIRSKLMHIVFDDAEAFAAAMARSLSSQQEFYTGRVLYQKYFSNMTFFEAVKARNMQLNKQNID